MVMMVLLTIGVAHRWALEFQMRSGGLTVPPTDEFSDKYPRMVGRYLLIVLSTLNLYEPLLLSSTTNPGESAILGNLRVRVLFGYHQNIMKSKKVAIT
jgi:hypothetical protein